MQLERWEREVWEITWFCEYQDEAESGQVISVTDLTNKPNSSKYSFPMFEKVIQTLDWSVSVHFKKSITG